MTYARIKRIAACKYCSSITFLAIFAESSEHAKNDFCCLKKEIFYYYYYFLHKSVKEENTQ